MTPPPVEEISSNSESIRKINESPIKQIDPQYEQQSGRQYEQQQTYPQADQPIQQMTYRNPNTNEEFVLVPTPVDPSEYEKLNQIQNNNNNNPMLNLNPQTQNAENFLYPPNNSNEPNEPNFLETPNQFQFDEKFSNMVERGNSTDFASLMNPKAFEDAANLNSPNMYSEKIQNLINLQQKDYEKYFSALNDLEYQKFLKNINNDQQINIAEEMEKAESNLDFTSVVNKLNNNKTMNYPVNTNNSNIVIDLPQSKKEVEDSYLKLFNDVNMNNSMSFIQKNKDIILDDEGKAPMYGTTDSKVRKFKPVLIGQANKTSIHPNDYKQKETLSEEKKKEQTDLEMEKRGKESYPRFRSVLPHELADKEEKEQLELQKQKKFDEMKKKIEGTSLVQNLIKSADKEAIAKALDRIISKRTKKLQEETKTNLHNCKRSCDSTCKRVSEIKEETEELCQLKCYVACSDNSLYKLLN